MANHWKNHDSKQCKCGAIFSKVGNQSDKRWEETLNCPRCREKRKGKQHPVNAVHHVIHPLLDKFLRGAI